MRCSRPIACAPLAVPQRSASRTVSSSALGHPVARVEGVVAHAALELQAEAHLAEHVTRVGGHHVAGQARAHAELERAADDRVAHPHLHLGLRAGGHLAVVARPGGGSCARRACCSARAPGRAEQAVVVELGEPLGDERRPTLQPVCRTLGTPSSRAERASAIGLLERQQSAPRSAPRPSSPGRRRSSSCSRMRRASASRCSCSVNTGSAIVRGVVAVGEHRADARVAQALRSPRRRARGCCCSARSRASS